MKFKLDEVAAMGFSWLAFLVAMLLVLMLGFLVFESWPIISSLKVLSLFSDEGWYPLENLYGMLPMVVASLLVALGSAFVALPLGLAAAIYLYFYAPKFLRLPYSLVLNILAGMPSVVYGLWGLTVLVPIIAQWQAPGVSLLAAILVVSLMILPTIALTSHSALMLIPQDLLKASTALAISPYQWIISIALPVAKKGIITGVLLAFVRALGETIAVLMVAGNIVQFPTSMFAPVRVLTANIALEMAYASDIHRASLFASGLLLTLVVCVVVWVLNVQLNDNTAGHRA